MLFSWLHISDLHARHGDEAYRHEQAQVVRELLESLGRLPEGLPRVDAIFATGDLAFSGGRRDPDEYRDVRDMLEGAAARLGVARARVFVVPGNHDVDRKALERRPDLVAWLEGMRGGGPGLSAEAAHGAHTDRFAQWLDLAAAVMPELALAPDGSWHCDLEAQDGLPVRVVGLNTALLSQDEADEGKLRIGWDQANRALTTPADRLVLVLGHHPLSWLGDPDSLLGPLARRADLYLHGHVHAQQNVAMFDGGGDIRVTAIAGAIHLDPAERPGGKRDVAHAYSFGAISGASGGPIMVRMWPRRWVPSRGFLQDALNCLPDKLYGELPLPRSVRWPGGVSSKPTAASSASPPPAAIANPRTAPTYRAPLEVYVVWRPEENQAADIANHLFATLHRSPSDPFGYEDLDIPVYFRSIPARGGAVPSSIDLTRAESTAIVALFGETMLDDDAKDFRDYLRGLRASVDAHPGRASLVPIALDEAATKVIGLDDINFIRAYESEGAARLARVTNGVAHHLHRLLRGAAGGGTAAAPAAAIQVFVSHAKADGNDPALVVRARLMKEDGLKSFFDRDDIAPAGRFADQIEDVIGAKHVVLLALLTDVYESRQWCEHEVVTARQERRPIVVIDARRKARGNLPFLGYAPTLAWDPDGVEFWDELQRTVVLEALRYAYVPDYLASVELLWNNAIGTSVHVARKPDPVDVLAAQQYLVHPDPPLPPAAAAMFAQGGRIALATPSTLPVTHQARPGATAPAAVPSGRLFEGKTIALSISESPDQAARGYGTMHLVEAMAEFARHVIFQHGNVAYGGDLRAGGFTEELFTLATQAASERAAAKREGIVACHLAWPIHLNLVPARSRALAPAVAFRKLPDVSGFIVGPDAATPDVNKPEGLLAWAQNMTAMRRQMAAATDGRILMGGPVAKSLSAMPGLVEEALVTLDAGKPLFLIGAFGGCAELVWNALNGRPTPALDLEFQCAARPAVREMLPLYNPWAARHGYPEVDYPKLRKRLADYGVAALDNGLTPAENERLMYTAHLPEMIALVLLGFQRRFART